MRRIGCPDCGLVVDLSWRNPCECRGELVMLRSASEVLAFKLRHEGRHDEAATVERVAREMAS